MKRYMCPSCHHKSIDLTKYISMAVLSHELALFTVRCPECGKDIKGIWPIPSSMQGQVQDVADRLGAGMHPGYGFNYPRNPHRPDSPDSTNMPD